MKTSLTFADPEPRANLSILLYGPSGIGKTTAACTSPGPIIYCNADGPGALRFARKNATGKEIMELPLGAKKVEVDDRWVPVVRPVLEQLFIELRSGDLKGLGTIVLDSLGRIYDLLLDEHARGLKPTLPQRGDVNTFLERFVLSLLEQPVNLVLVAHDNPVVVSGKEEDGTQEVELFPHTGTNNPGLAKKLMRPLDVVAYCGRVIEGEGDEQTEKFIGQTFNAGGRHAKDRTDVIGHFAELDITDWIERVNETYTATTEGAHA